jgi:chemotaxis family two-component system response regulator PixG
LTAFFNGRYTIWDISLKMKQPLTRIVRLVHHFYQQGAVELQEVADLPLPITIEPVNKPKNNLPAIACVDDSPLIGRYLEEILAPAGYRVIYIQDPIQALTTLTEEKPLLIFLDLVMPKTDGYNVCNFLRKSEACSKIPVIMLTSSNGLINRARAKLAGADDFLTKPFDSEQILQVVRKYLGAAVPAR